MSGGEIWRACAPQHCSIIKRPKFSREVEFYKQLAPRLREQGIPIPNLEWSASDADSEWMVIEHIPQLLPLARRGADTEMLRVLNRLHTTALDLSDIPFETYRPRWDSRLTADALGLFPRELAHQLDAALGILQKECEPLFTPTHPLSGDPNPRNWGMRADGSLVLFDWERFCFGSPALDLAITVPGLGNAALYQRAAAMYSSFAPEGNAVELSRINQLAREMWLGKIWSVVEFLAEHAEDASAADPDTIAWLVGEFPNTVFNPPLGSETQIILL